MCREIFRIIPEPDREVTAFAAERLARFSIHQVSPRLLASDCLLFVSGCFSLNSGRLCHPRRLLPHVRETSTSPEADRPATTLA